MVFMGMLYLATSRHIDGINTTTYKAT